MRIEITSAAQFLVDLVRLNNTGSLNDDQLEEFKSNVSETLQRHYTNHWFPDRPFKGSGYRCIRINGKMDPLIARAGFMMGLAVSFLRSMFPSELTMWVDPREVSYRIGENGSICILYEGEKPAIISTTTPKKGDENPLAVAAPTEVKTPEKALKAPPPPQQTPSPPPALPQHHQPPPQHQVHHHHHPHHHAHHHLPHHQPLFSPSSPLQHHSPPMSPVTSQQQHHHHHQQQQAAAAAMQLSMFLRNSKESAGLIKCKESLPRGLEARSLQMDRLFVSS